MKFSHFGVLRVGSHITLRAVVDYDHVGGQALEFNLDADSTDIAAMYEALFQRMILAAEAFEDVSDEVLQATLNLSKGRQDEHD